ncbi:hypothetical protein [Vandammella animalimorsus]|uniref:Uncharacterized protein n=1 Tax=Vandammella animalimorsus TaxID=2029117 RepID=A0A2A2ABS6_9BURK|nr:hypothetical protein [Vandammella animalimorsus]PAT35188.1 hypothetical protein CK620_04600 [Vandammella animalimorsus]
MLQSLKVHAGLLAMAGVLAGAVPSLALANQPAHPGDEVALKHLVNMQLKKAFGHAVILRLHGDGSGSSEVLKLHSLAVKNGRPAPTLEQVRHPQALIAAHPGDYATGQKVDQFGGNPVPHTLTYSVTGLKPETDYTVYAFTESPSGQRGELRSIQVRTKSPASLPEFVDILFEPKLVDLRTYGFIGSPNMNGVDFFYAILPASEPEPTAQEIEANAWAHWPTQAQSFEGLYTSVYMQPPPNQDFLPNTTYRAYTVGKLPNGTYGPVMAFEPFTTPAVRKAAEVTNIENGQTLKHQVRIADGGGQDCSLSNEPRLSQNAHLGVLIPPLPAGLEPAMGLSFTAGWCDAGSTLTMEVLYDDASAFSQALQAGETYRYYKLVRLTGVNRFEWRDVTDRVTPLSNVSADGKTYKHGLRFDLQDNSDWDLSASDGYLHDPLVAVRAKGLVPTAPSGAAPVPVGAPWALLLAALGIAGLGRRFAGRKSA